MGPLKIAFGLVLAMSAGGWSPPSNREAVAPRPCPSGDTHVRGEGCGRPDGRGGREVLLEDGSRVGTHGPDGDAALLELSPGEDGSSSAYRCVSRSTRHVKLHYIYPLGGDHPNNYEVNKIRRYFYFAANTVDARSLELGGPRVDVPVLCTSEGVPAVTVFESKRTRARASFSSLISELRARGNTSTLAQYWTWYAGRPGDNPYGGQATRDLDETASTSNANNFGPAYSFTYGGTGTTMLHEAGHNWGAVGEHAPHGNRSHCYDENDIMCYDDDLTDGRSTFEACYEQTWDCRGDTYFNPRPKAGSYLATYWNVGLPYNQFLLFSG